MPHEKAKKNRLCSLCAVQSLLLKRTQIHIESHQIIRSTRCCQLQQFTIDNCLIHRAEPRNTDRFTASISTSLSYCISFVKDRDSNCPPWSFSILLNFEGQSFVHVQYCTIGEHIDAKSTNSFSAMAQKPTTYM